MIKLAVRQSSRPTMPLLPSRHYVSDHTRFIRDLLEKARRWVVERTLAWLSKCRGLLVRYEKKPEIETSQRVGREIWWDKLPSEVEAQREMNAGRVPQKAYVYYSLK